MKGNQTLGYLALVIPQITKKPALKHNLDQQWLFFATFVFIEQFCLRNLPTSPSLSTDSSYVNGQKVINVIDVQKKIHTPDLEL